MTLDLGATSETVKVVEKGLKLRVGEGITGWVARTGKPANVGDVAKDPRYIMLRPEVASELAVPLEVGGEVRGVINVDSDRPDAFSASDQELLEALAIQAARVVHNTWIYEQLRLKVRLFEALASVSRTISSTLNLDEALNVITREAFVLMRGKMCSLTTGRGSEARHQGSDARQRSHHAVGLRAEDH